MGIKELKKRLKELMIDAETQSAFARRAGIAQSTISRIFNGQLPKLAVLNRIAQNLGVPPVYLLEALATPNGEDPELKQYAEQLGVTDDALRHFPKNMAPVLNIAACGALIESHDLDFPPGVADEFLPTTSSDDNCFFVVAQGESMKPTVLEGDRLLVEPSLPLVNNSIVVAIINQEATVKRYRRVMSGAMLTPDNPDYDPIFIPNEILAAARIYRITLIMRKV
ncbi:MAG: hypothetical protein Kow0090_20650 [Myxococcota bacterium]